LGAFRPEHVEIQITIEESKAMPEQIPFDRRPTGAADRQDRSQPVSGGLDRQQIQALLRGDAVAASRRAFLAAALATGTSAAATATLRSSTPVAGTAAAQPGLHTRLTRDYGVQLPFVGAGMGFIATPPLVAAISNAGGIGVLGNAIEPPPSTQALIQQIKRVTPNLFGIDFIVDDSAFGPATTDAHINVCIAEQVRLVVFHMSVPPREWVDRLHAAGARVWMQAGSVKQAAEAAALGIDAVIAQGSEAGGHNKSKTPALLLLPRIIEAVHPLLVLAAGGIADGEGVFRALSAGAEGVWVGTRLVASSEAYAHEQYKARLVAAKENTTVTTTMFGPEYPGRPYRVLRNRVVEEFAGREDTIPKPPPPPAVIGKTLLFPRTLRQPYEMPKFSVIVPTPDTVGDFEEMGMPAGTSVELIHDIQPAARIVATMMNEARSLFERELATSVR
jgi:NAD(P)H-dependent flavin oxidoreductase YrpB (nitropropane dioxygenase family)